MAHIIEHESTSTTLSRPPRELQAEQIARDLALMDEIEALAQAVPNRRHEAGLGSLPDDAVADAYKVHGADLQ